MAAGNSKSDCVIQSVVEKSEAILSVLEQADRAQELLDENYERLGKIQSLENAFPASYANAVSAFDRGQSQLANQLYAKVLNPSTSRAHYWMNWKPIGRANKNRTGGSQARG